MASTTSYSSLVQRPSSHTEEQHLLALLKSLNAPRLAPLRSSSTDKVEMAAETSKDSVSPLYTRPSLALPKLKEERTSEDDDPANCLKKLAEAFSKCYASLSDSAIKSTDDLATYQKNAQDQSILLLEQVKIVEAKMEKVFQDQMALKSEQDYARTVSAAIGIVVGIVSIVAIGISVYSSCATAAAAENAEAEAAGGSSTTLAVTAGGDSSAAADAASAAAKSASSGPMEVGSNVTSIKWTKLLSTLGFTGLMVTKPAYDARSSFNNAKADQDIADQTQELKQPTSVREFVRYLFQYTQSLCQRKSTEPTNLNQMSVSILSTMSKIFQDWQSMSQEITKMG